MKFVPRINATIMNTFSKEQLKQYHQDGYVLMKNPTDDKMGRVVLYACHSGTFHQGKRMSAGHQRFTSPWTS